MNADQLKAKVAMLERATARLLPLPGAGENYGMWFTRAPLPF